MECFELAVFDGHGEFEIKDAQLLEYVAGGVPEGLAAPLADQADENGMCPNAVCGSDQVCGNTSCWGINGYCNKNYVCIDFFCLL